MESVIETIKKRCSVRSYSGIAIEEDKKQKINEYLKANCEGPFGNKVRFQIVEASENDKNELKQLGTYGAIKGAHLFIAGAVKKGHGAMEDFGYCMERNILMAAALGLGTVWLGGFLNRSAFAVKINASEDEVVPAVTPFGYPADKRSIADAVIRFVAGSKKRKSFEELFLSGSHQEVLTPDLCGEYFQVLESVRLGPSASNKQPWRIIKAKDNNIYHFYLKENPRYNNYFKEIKIQNLDMGIAMCHFELSAGELKLKGKWMENEPGIDSGDLKYIASWIGEEN
ncbi:MAG: nitroreductase family protein [Clostridia bacterium]|nr:nitroreductase family protein [Clostridia bacterium]